MAWGPSSMNYIIPLPVPMRIIPSIVLSDITKFIISKGASSSSPKTIKNINSAYLTGNMLAGSITVNETDLTSGEMFIMKLNGTGAYIDLSADL